jgi:hypothetical protein
MLAIAISSFCHLCLHHQLVCFPIAFSKVSRESSSFVTNLNKPDAKRQNDQLPMSLSKSPNPTCFSLPKHINILSWIHSRGLSATDETKIWSLTFFLYHSIRCHRATNWPVGKWFLRVHQLVNFPKHSSWGGISPLESLEGGLISPSPSGGNPGSDNPCHLMPEKLQPHEPFLARRILYSY